MADGQRGLAIGTLSENGAPVSPFDGTMDSVQIYRRALSEAEVCTMVGGGSSCLPCDICSM